MQKTFDEILKEIENTAREKFNLANLTYTKTGVLGFLVYLLTYFRNDLIQYYNYLYNESNIITSNRLDTILKLAQQFGYIPKQAIPAKFIGNLNIFIPKTNDTNKHVILINRDTEFKIDKLIWTLENEIYIEYFGYSKTAKVVIRDIGNENETKIINVPIIDYNDMSNVITIPSRFINIEQKQKHIKKINIPYYDFGSSYSTILDAKQYNGKYINNIRVYIKLPDSNEFEEFKPVFNKYLYTSNDKVVFSEYLDSEKIKISTGDGIYGYYIPQNSIMLIEFETTYGSLGNIQYGTVIYLHSKDKVILDNIPVTNKEFIQLITTENINSGQDILTIDKLKRDVINYIKTRDNIITNDDIKSFFDSYNIDVYIRPLTYKIYQPEVFIYMVLPDPYFNIIRHTTDTISIDNNPENNLLISKGYKKIYQTKGIYPKDNIRVIEVIDSKKLKLESINNIHIGDYIYTDDINTLSPERLYKVLDIDTDNKIITLDKELPENNNINTIYIYKQYTLDLILPMYLYYDSEFDVYRGFNIRENLLLPLTQLNDIEFIFTPQLTLEIINITKNQNKYIYKLKFNIKYNKDTDNIDDYLNDIKDKLILKNSISNNNNSNNNKEIKITLDNILQENNFTKTIEYQTDLEPKKFIKEISLSTIELDIYNKYNDELIAKYKGNFELIETNEDLAEYPIINNKIYLVPFIYKDDYKTYKEYIEHLIFMAYDVFTNKYYKKQISGIKYRLLLLNTIEYRYRYNKFKDMDTNILLPLRIKLKLYIDSKKPLPPEFKDLNSYINYLKEHLAIELLTKFKGTDNIKYYPTEIIKYIKDLDNRIINNNNNNNNGNNNDKEGGLIKHIEVIEPDIYIEIDDSQIKEYITKNLSNDKLKQLTFTPAYFWFDINQIDIEFQPV